MTVRLGPFKGRPSNIGRRWGTMQAVPPSKKAALLRRGLTRPGAGALADFHLGSGGDNFLEWEPAHSR